MNKKSERVGFITVMYGLAAVLVVFGHSHPLHCDYPDELKWLTSFIYCFHMPCFFYIAGFLIYHTSEGRKISEWWIKRCRRLLFPYVVLTVLAWVPKMMLRELMNDKINFSFPEIIRILFIPREGIWGHFWFIPTYLLLSLAGGVWLVIWKRYRTKILWFTLAVALYLNFQPIPIAWLGLKDISENFIYVFLGIVTYKCVYGCEHSYAGLKGIVSLAISYALFYSVSSYIMGKICCFLMIYSMLCISKYVDYMKWKWPDYIGRHAFTIFIYSWPIQAVVEILVVVIMKCSWEIAYLAMLAGGLFGPLLIWETYTRKMKRTRFLDGMIGVRQDERCIC